MKALKWVGMGLAALVIGTAAIGYVLLARFDVEQMRALIQDGAKDATGRDLVLAGDIDLAISLHPSIEVTDVRFGNASWGSRPDMATLAGFALEVSAIPLLSGEIKVNRLVLDGADVLLETDAEGIGNWSFAPSDSAATGASEGGAGTIPRIDELMLRDSKLTYRDGRTGHVMELWLNEASIRQIDGFLTIAGDGAYGGTPFTISGKVGDLAALLSGAPIPLEIELGVAGAVFKASGRIVDAKPDLDIAATGASLADLSALSGSPLPMIGPYDVKGHLGADGDAFTVAGFAARFGGSDLAGDLGIALGGERPRFTASLTATTIDLADLGTAGGDQAAPDVTSPYVILDTPLPLDALAAFDADLTVAVGALEIDDKTTVNDLAMTLTVAGGSLSVDPFTARYGGGTIAGSLALDVGAEATRLTFKTTVDDLDYGQLAKTYGVTDKVAGTVDIAIDLAGAGTTPRAIARTLDGRTEITGDKGTIDNQLLAVVAVGLGDVMGPLFGGKDETPLNCIVSRFAIAGGVATSDAQVIDARTFAVAGTGTIDLRDETLNMQFDTSSRQTALVSLAIPFNVGGTLKNPSVTPDPAGAALAAAKIAGTAFNPLAALGAMAALGGGGESGGNACAAAIESQPAAVKSSVIPSVEEAEAVIEDVGGEVGEVVEGVAGGVAEGLNNLFGSD